MRHDTKRALEELRDALEKGARQLRDDLAGWSISAEKLASREIKTANAIRAILSADEDLECVAEAAGGFNVLTRDRRINGDLHQRVQYIGTKRFEDQIWTREAMLEMTSKQYAEKVNGFPSG